MRMKLLKQNVQSHQMIERDLAGNLRVVWESELKFKLNYIQYIYRKDTANIMKMFVEQEHYLNVNDE